MDIKKSKITELNLQAEKFNDMYIFTIVFENGDIGKMYKKKEKTYEGVGDEVEYTISPKGTVKIAFKGESKFNSNTATPGYSNNKNDVQDDIRFSVAFKGAIELAGGGVISVDEVEKFTLKYDEFLKDKKSVEMPF
jgi:hypothetical protein|tara:strand:+ start:2334 stop:2741 length:408 start_codon:yes stop_codon:yes gene_type:complete